ncbi:MAG TPA: TetR/AcrR family transcriptional regulator [Phenylobacterium sp.]|uniref:TetR/AcrR family transcriptional regulator n=1 Tax=Phenylobacterium sp. TaxID=1871053 RepID=UPI002B46A19C|nr:TetR/AcrR family transcriptional regulator [Phenylobacterium sp.]HKR88014.1 TetR/AcrR family transcriptional regulator [Phenylobacterium sp.]
MDAAEELFGNDHYDSISMRDVAQKADVLLGLVSYHFKSKEKLFEEVVARRADEANAARLAALRKHEDPTIEQVLDAFVRPAVEMGFRPEWRNYSRLTNQVYHGERWRDLNIRLFYPTAREFYQALVRAIPGASETALARGFTYTVFAMLGAVYDNNKYEDLTGDDSLATADDILRSLLPFAAGGLKALAATGVDAASPPRPPASPAPNVIPLGKS